VPKNGCTIKKINTTKATFVTDGNYLHLKIFPYAPPVQKILLSTLSSASIEHWQSCQFFLSALKVRQPG
jgi:hypothetical protein